MTSTFSHHPVRVRLAAAVVPALVLSVAAPLVNAPPASAAPTAGLPGSGELSALASARPATLAEAERQFAERTPTEFRDQGLAWAPCPAESFAAGEQEGALAAGLECATVIAPRDWNAPDDGHTVEVAISRLPQPGGRPERTVLSNPGGPGVAGLSFPAAYGALPAFAATEFIGVDVRGTGASTSLTCAEDLNTLYVELPDPRDRSMGALAEVEAGMSSVAADCAADPLTPFITTEQTVADWDLIRHLLGRETVDYYGASGGTWTGAQYATYFPARVGRFVLDSNVDVTTSWQETRDFQPFGFQRSLDEDFAGYAAEYSWLFHLGDTPAEVSAAYERLRADLQNRPVPLGGDEFDGFLLDAFVVPALYDNAEYENIAWTLVLLRAAHAALVVGDLVGLADLTRQADEQMAAVPDPFSSRMLSTFHAITCNDTTWSQGAEFWNAHGDDLGSQFPLHGWRMTWQACGYWERPELTLPKPDGRDLPPMLVLQALRDGASPAESGQNTARTFDGAYITVEDGNHGVYGKGNACVDDVVAEFFASGTVPEQDLACPGTPAPAPGSQLLG